jgi:hypothetical protein
MKSEIVIKQGITTVVLYAENEFEKDFIEKVIDSKIGYETKTTVTSNYSYHSHSKQRIEINLIEKQ